MSKDYNWWEDPKNREEVERLSWWNHEQNKTTYPLPISIVKDGKYFVTSLNDDSKKILGHRNACAQGKTEKEAIDGLFEIIRFDYDYLNDCRLKYSRWVPLKVGPWSKGGGRWFSVFGINVYFRYGSKNKGGWFVPFTFLNISIYSEWAVYERYKNEKRRKKANHTIQQ